MKSKEIISRLQNRGNLERENYSFYLNKVLVDLVRTKFPGIKLSHLVEELLRDFIADLEEQK